MEKTAWEIIMVYVKSGAFIQTSIERTKKKSHELFLTGYQLRDIVSVTTWDYLFSSLFLGNLTRYSLLPMASPWWRRTQPPTIEGCVEELLSYISNTVTRLWGWETLLKKVKQREKNREKTDWGVLPISCSCLQFNFFPKLFTFHNFLYHEEKW